MRAGCEGCGKALVADGKPIWDAHPVIVRNADLVSRLLPDSEVLCGVCAQKRGVEKKMAEFEETFCDPNRQAKVAFSLCPRCLRAHDPNKPIDCECGYTTTKPVSENWQAGTVGIALEDSKAVPGTNGKVHEVVVSHETLVNCQFDVVGGLRRHSERMTLPGWSNIEKITLGPDDVLVLHYPSGDVEAAERCRTLAVEGFSDRPSILLPDGFDAKSMPLAELRTFRDRLNEVIYDKEQGEMIGLLGAFLAGWWCSFLFNEIRRSYLSRRKATP